MVAMEHKMLKSYQTVNLAVAKMHGVDHLHRHGGDILFTLQ